MALGHAKNEKGTQDQEAASGWGLSAFGWVLFVGCVLLVVAVGYIANRDIKLQQEFITHRDTNLHYEFDMLVEKGTSFDLRLTVDHFDVTDIGYSSAVVSGNYGSMPVKGRLHSCVGDILIKRDDDTLRYGGLQLEVFKTHTQDELRSCIVELVNQIDDYLKPRLRNYESHDEVIAGDG